MTAGADVARYAQRAGFPDGELVTAVAVSWAESGFGEKKVNRSNSNGSTDYGLWQINSIHGYPELANGQWADPQTNARLAYQVWKKQGWNAWSVHKPTDTLGYARYVAAIPAAQAFVLAGTGIRASASSALGAPGDLAESAGGAVDDGLNVAAQIAAEPLAVLKWFTTAEAWWRIAKFGVGAALLIGGVYLLITSAIAKPIVNVAKKGKL